MKSKLPLFVLLLVLVPTAILSLLAARSLNQDVVLARERLELSAANAVRSAVEAIESQLVDESDRIQAAMRECLAAGGDVERFRSAAGRLELDRVLVKRVYLFMNPWGFVWPEDNEVDDDRRIERDQLLAALRRVVVSRPAADAPIPLTLDGHHYRFTSLGGRQVFYAGYELDTDAFVDVAAVRLRQAAGGGILLTAKGPLLDLTSSPTDEAVIVTDSLGQQARVSPFTPLPDTLTLLAVNLPAPVDNVVITAYAEDPGEFKRMGAMRMHLYAWGIVLLAGGILGGVWLVISEARAEVRRARTRSDFVIGVSHDLRTPLASMKMLAESLLLDHVSDPGKRRVFLATIVNESNRLGQLIERVLFLIRFGQGGVQYRRSPGDLTAIVRDTVETFSDRFAAIADLDESGLTPRVSLTVEADLPTLELDEGAIRQVLLNLLDNAAKYGKKAVTAAAEPSDAATLPAIAVSVGCGQHRRRRGPAIACAVVTVKDNGIGIEPGEMKRIFGRYYRSERASHQHVAGVGLGLAVCKHAVEAHEGWMTVASEPGQGSAFSFFIPIVPRRRAGPRPVIGRDKVMEDRHGDR